MKNAPKTYSDDDWRICIKCKQYKLWNKFYKQKGGHRWHHSKCKICDNNASRSKKEKTREEEKQRYEKAYKKTSRIQKTEYWEKEWELHLPSGHAPCNRIRFGVNL